jgi:hypothetical protein
MPHFLSGRDGTMKATPYWYTARAQISPISGLIFSETRMNAGFACAENTVFAHDGREDQVLSSLVPSMIEYFFLVFSTCWTPIEEPGRGQEPFPVSVGVSTNRTPGKDQEATAEQPGRPWNMLMSRGGL